MPQILLYDASTGELAPIVHGDAIRVEIHTADLASQGQVDVASTRPFVLFSLLQRLLQSEGLPARFLFGSPGAGELLRELELSAELAQEEEEEREEERRSSIGLSQDELPEIALANQAGYGDAVQEEDLGDEGIEDDEDLYEGRCVDIRFGAAREGEQEWAGGETAGGMTLAEAMRRFGHHSLVFYLMGTHYSQPLGDPIVGMTNACRHVRRLRDTLSQLRFGEPSPQDMHHHVQAFREALATDLDTPSAFVALFEWVLEAEQRGCEQIGDSHLREMLELLELADLGEGGRRHVS